MTHNKNTSDDDFFAQMSDVRPIKQDKVISIKLNEPSLAQSLKREAIEQEVAKQSNPFSVERVEPVDVLDPIGYKKPGVQDGVYKNLRLGKYSVDRVIGIQNMHIEKLKDALYLQLKQAYQQGVRTLLIQHGLGKQTKPFPALAKSCLFYWLPLLPEVLAFHSATRQHGGLGATYVMLKKHPQVKLHNKELHRKR